MTVRLVNLTPHPLVVFDGDSQIFNLPPDGPPARLEEVLSDADPIPTTTAKLPVVEVSYSDRILGLPDPRPGVSYVVSRVTAAATRWRDDLVFPFDEVRDASGMIIGCRALGRFVEHSSEDPHHR